MNYDMATPQYFGLASSYGTTLTSIYGILNNPIYGKNKSVIPSNSKTIAHCTENSRLISCGSQHVAVYMYEINYDVCVTFTALWCIFVYDLLLLPLYLLCKLYH